MFRNRRRKHKRIETEENLIQAEVSLDNAKQARLVQERKLEQEKESIIGQLFRIRTRMVTHNHVTETLTRIIQDDDCEDDSEGEDSVDSVPDPG